MLSIYRRNKDFFEDFFNDFKLTGSNLPSGMMKTDIKELDNNYVLSVELPGYDKDDVKVSMEDGYLTIETEKKSENEESNSEGKFIRKERYYGLMKRSYYVGDVTIDDLKGTFDKGILHLEIPKEVKKVPEKRYLELK